MTQRLVENTLHTLAHIRLYRLSNFCFLIWCSRNTENSFLKNGKLEFLSKALFLSILSLKP